MFIASLKLGKKCLSGLKLLAVSQGIGRATCIKVAVSIVWYDLERQLG
jgi:hypothetical protein